MNLLKRLLVIVVILFPFFSFAQSNYKQGLVVNLKGDTLHGYIDLQEWGGNPTHIYFKASRNDPNPQKFTPVDISYFAVSKVAAFRGYVGPISVDPTNIEKIERFRDTATRIDTVFLKVIQSGKNVILYSYIDYIKKRFFVFDIKTKTLAELVYRLYFVENEINHVTTASQNGYKQQLLFISQQYDPDNEILQKLLFDAEYDKIDLVGICRKINEL